MAEHAAGKSIREIAAAYGHSTQTVRDYALGRRTPGEPAARDDDFAPFAAYCRRRLADDPHLRAVALLAEITRLGFPGTASTFYRAMERHQIQPHPCPHCHLARISGYVLQPPTRQPQPFPLPVPGSLVNGETLASFLSRLAAANRTSLDALLDILPSWFRIKTRWHDDRWQHERLTAWADDAAACLAVVSGSTIAAVKNALPAFGGKRGHARPGRHRMPPLHSSPPHPAAGPGPSSRPSPGLHQARHLAVRPGKTAVQRQRLPRHPGCRTPGTPAPPPLHRRAADLLHDPGTCRQNRPRVEAPDHGPHRVEPPAGHRIRPAGTVPGRGLSRCHRRCLRHPQSPP